MNKLLEVLFGLVYGATGRPHRPRLRALIRIVPAIVILSGCTRTHSPHAATDPTAGTARPVDRLTVDQCATRDAYADAKAATQRSDFRLLAFEDFPDVLFLSSDPAGDMRFATPYRLITGMRKNLADRRWQAISNGHAAIAYVHDYNQMIFDEFRKDKTPH